MKQSITLLFSVLLLSFGSCNKEDIPLPEAVKAISQSYDCSCEPYIDLYRWKGQQVFVLKFRGPACNWRPSFFEADGSILELPANYTFDQFQQEGIVIRNIWTCGK